MMSNDDIWWANLVKCGRIDMPRRKTDDGDSWGQCEEHGKECTRKNCKYYQDMIKIQARIRSGRRISHNDMNIRFGQ